MPLKIEKKMNIEMLGKFENQAVYESDGFGYSDDDKYLFKPIIKGWYYFPEDDNSIILVIENVPDLQGHWDCFGNVHYSDCPYLSKQRQHLIFPEKPKCKNNISCLAEKRESFVVVFSLSKTEITQINHHHIGDFSSEYFNETGEIEDYRIAKESILKVDLPD